MTQRMMHPPRFTGARIMREQLKSEVSNEVVRQHLAALNEAARIERFNLDGTPVTPAEGDR